MEYWGKHLIINVAGCDKQKATDAEFIKDFTKELVQKIDMKPYGEPQVVHFADGTDKAGWTMIQLIETSNIIGHFLDDSGDLYLDVFSCKDFDEMVVYNLIKFYFSPDDISMMTIMRDARK